MLKSEKVNIFWFRRDLRLNDNVALYWSLKSNIKTLPIFIFDEDIIKNLKEDDKRVLFIYNSLSEIREKLNSKGSELVVYKGKTEKVFKDLISTYNIDSVYSNEDYEPYSIKRDQKISKLLKKNNIDFFQYKDHCIFSKAEVLKNDGTPYTMFTPYKRKWLQQLTPNDMASYRTISLVKNFATHRKTKWPSLKSLGLSSDNQTFSFPSKNIKKSILEKYKEHRDYPAMHSTTHIGLHLRFGTVSIRKAVQLAHESCETWLSELVWREFFMQILYNFPHVSKKEFKQKYEGIQWRNKKNEFKKWCNGETGYPLVDAGMRELNSTGYMHNRVRMVVASFLVKDLLIDWRWGEKYFAEKLLDYEMASNNGNWQWVAGTGCDSAPYFRIFNPQTQQKNFDPKNEYIKKWIPEYETDQYSKPMLDHNVAYHRAISTYKSSIK